MAKKTTQKQNKLEPLEQIKRLLILVLMTMDVKSEAIGNALNVDSSAIRHMVSSKQIKKGKKAN